jgi:hypothetical protein
MGPSYWEPDGGVEAPRVVHHPHNRVLTDGPGMSDAMPRVVGWQRRAARAGCGRAPWLTSVEAERGISQKIRFDNSEKAKKC